jgi:hypothetical protein
MADFPSLSTKPAQSEFREESAYDPTLRSKSEGGYLKTRPRYTRMPRKWRLVYPWMSGTDKDTLWAFEVARKVGGESFNWTNPQDSQVYVVRFGAPILYRLLKVKGDDTWRVEFDLEEV